MPTRIAHISDLHFGNDLVLRSLLDRRVWWRTEDATLQKNLVASLRDIKPDYLVVSGDIVNKCHPAIFREAAKKVRDLAVSAGLDPASQLLVVAGNHDVQVFPNDDQFFGRIQPFVQFLKDVFDEDNYRTRTERFIRVDLERRLCFLCLDTSLRDRIAVAEGRVGEAQWRWARKKLSELAATHQDFRRFVKVAVLHHHPYQIPGGGPEKFMPLDDAGECQKFLEEYGFQIVLHGHKHYFHAAKKPFASGSHVTVIGAGTACCPIPSENRDGNSFNLIEFEPSTNVLSVTKVRANASRVFERSTAEVFTLFRPSERGYKMREYVVHTVIKNAEGDCEMLDRRVGLVADSEAGTGVDQVHFWIKGLPQGAVIEAFECRGADVREIVYTTPPADLARERSGNVILKSPLKWGGNAVDFDVTSRVSRGFRMRRTAGYEREALMIENTHPTDLLTLELDFPAGFNACPEPVITDPTRKEPVDQASVACSFDRDPFGNRFVLRVRAPMLGYSYGFVWPLA